MGENPLSLHDAVPAENIEQLAAPQGVESKRRPNVSRRDFLKKAALAAGAVLAGSTLGKLEQATAALRAPESEPTMPELTPELKRRVEVEIEDARTAFASGRLDDLLKNKYAVSCLYYSDNFFANELTPDRIENNPPRQILAGLKDLVTPDARSHYLRQLRFRYFSQGEGQATEQNTPAVPPLEHMDWGTGSNHADAIDLFTAEGTPVKAMTSGVVLLAENGWTRKDLLSTTTPRGGNTVILYDPENSEFHRYCHLQSSQVKNGEVVSAGATLGPVGHTGVNASERGHGGHLHLEINAYNGERRVMEAKQSRELRDRMRQLTRARGLHTR